MEYMSIKKIKWSPKLLFEDEDDGTGHTGFYLPKVETKDYNGKIDGRNFFD